MERGEEVSFINTTGTSLKIDTIHELFDIEQDMWSRREGLGEYVYCDSCGSTFSKQDIYGGIEKSTYNLTVSAIEKILSFSHTCSCGGRLKHCYERVEYIPQMQERYSQESIITLMFFRGKIVGFMDGYIADFPKIYDLEFRSHYAAVGERRLLETIERLLGFPLPSELFSCSSMGTTEGFMSFRYIYLLLQYFFTHLPPRYDDITAITELNVGGNLHKIYALLGAQQVGLIDSPDIGESISTTDVYTSDIFIQKNLGKTYRSGFENDLRAFLRRYQAIMGK